MIDQPVIHSKTFSPRSDERINASKQLRAFFESLPDRKQAFQDLLRLCSDKDESVREKAINALEAVFPHVPDRDLAWDRLINLTAYPSERVLQAAVASLISVFPHTPDKDRAWKDLTELVTAVSSFEDVRREIVRGLPAVFPCMPDKQQLWNDLLEMTASEEEYVREKAAGYLGKVFPGLPEGKKGEAREKLLELIESGDEKVRIGAAKSFGDAFPSVPVNWKDEAGADEAWKDEAGEDEERKDEAGEDEAWKELLRLATSGDPDVREETHLSLASSFALVPDKESAWNELLRMAEDESAYARQHAVKVLISLIPYLEDRKKACSDLLRLSGEKDSYVSRKTARELSSNRLELSGEEELEKPYEPAGEKTVYARMEKTGEETEALPRSGGTGRAKTVWRDETERGEKPEEESKPAGITKAGPGSLSMTGDRDRYVRKNAAESLATSLSRPPDKREICTELLNLSSSTAGPSELKEDVSSLLSLYSGGEGKKQEIWDELLEMTEDQDCAVRKKAAEMLSLVYPGVEDKSGTFVDLLRLAAGKDINVRRKAVGLMSSAFGSAEDKQWAWNELVWLASEDEDREVRGNAVRALASAFPAAPGKDKAWKDFVKLSRHNDNYVQRKAVRAMGPAFYLVKDKTQAWRDMRILSEESYIYVQKYALRSLGKASLWRGLHGEDEVAYLFGLKEAVSYFKEASEIPAETKFPEFYLPFFESLLFVLASGHSFRKAGPEAGRYLSRMEKEAGEAGEKYSLLKTFEELAELLRKAGKLGPKDLPGKKELLENAILIFEKISDLLELTEEEAIFACKTVKKEAPKLGKVLLEQKIKETLSGIRYRARITCLKSKGTPTENLACMVSQKVREWTLENLEKDREKLDRQLEALLDILRSKIPFVPENMSLIEKVEDIREEEDLLERYRKVSRLLKQIPEAWMPSRGMKGF